MKLKILFVLLFFPLSFTYSQNSQDKPEPKEWLTVNFVEHIFKLKSNEDVDNYLMNSGFELNFVNSEYVAYFNKKRHLNLDVYRYSDTKDIYKIYLVNIKATVYQSFKKQLIASGFTKDGELSMPSNENSKGRFNFYYKNNSYGAMLGKGSSSEGNAYYDFALEELNYFNKNKEEVIQKYKDN